MAIEIVQRKMLILVVTSSMETSFMDASDAILVGSAGEALKLQIGRVQWRENLHLRCPWD